MSFICNCFARCQITCVAIAAGNLPYGKKESQDLAWERILSFFKEQLG